MKGTRLWQAPGSPIIQGRSRTERPFWERWIIGVAGAEAIVFLSAVLVALREPGVIVGSNLWSAGLAYVFPALPGCLSGAAFGVWFSRTMGWRRHWLVGAVMGAALAGVTLVVF